MDAGLLVSPHLDDAVLSCGQYLAGRPDVHVLTLFAGSPKDPTVLTDFDRRSGFVSAAEALMVRHREDRAALGALGAYALHGPHVDNQYRAPGTGSILPALVDTIAAAITTVAPVVLLAPLGLAHPDHLAASDAAITAATDEREIPLWLFEELPARVLWPELVAQRVDAIRERWHVDVEPDFAGTGDLAAKRAALTHYRSQQWAIDVEHTCLVPERFWRVTWAG